MPNIAAENSVIQMAKPRIKFYEALSLKPYLCPADKPTIGWGSTQYENGVKVTMKDPMITEARAEDLLNVTCSRIYRQIVPLLKRDTSLQQMAAFLILCFNIGVGARDGKKGDFADSDLLNAFNRGDFDTVAKEWPLWNKAHVGGKLVALTGLTKRRASELNLFLTGK